MLKPITAFIGGMITCALICSIGVFIYSSQRSRKITKIHKLEYPLLLSGDEKSNGLSMLPKGTTLYFDQAYPEGFTRYKVYINIDRLPLKLEELADPTSIIPIDGSAPDKDSLKKLLREYPLTKNDLEAILKSGKLSKDDVKEVLGDFLR
jgi:hypothetical protein